MRRHYLENWYFYSAAIGIGALIVLALGWTDWTWTRRLMLMQFALLNLHFLEEFGVPGGFPMIANKLELHSDDPRRHPLNQASVAFGNSWFALVVYLPAVIRPDIAWLALSVSLFGFLELVMHGAVFARMLHHWFNGGLVTASLMSVCSVVFLVQSYSAGTIPLWAYIPAIAWPMANYFIVFSWLMGKVWDDPDTAYPFSEKEMKRFSKWTERAVVLEEARGVDMNAHRHDVAMNDMKEALR